MLLSPVVIDPVDRVAGRVDRASLGSRGALPAVRSEAITGGSIPRLISISS